MTFGQCRLSVGVIVLLCAMGRSGRKGGIGAFNRHLHTSLTAFVLHVLCSWETLISVHKCKWNIMYKDHCIKFSVLTSCSVTCARTRCKQLNIIHQTNWQEILLGKDTVRWITLAFCFVVVFSSSELSGKWNLTFPSSWNYFSSSG